MNKVDTLEGIRQKVSSFKKRGETIGFVPTMGALHEGHLSLIRLAKKHADKVVVSIYVNPEQFAPGEDYEEYPRQLEEDLAKCEKLGVSVVFSPGDKIMYGTKKYLRIEIEELNKYMDGGSRPGFFEGVLLIVNKLFNIVSPDVAVFGQKDIQQYRILQCMVKEFNHNIELIMGPVIRADDGLALSSRNTYLDDQQRKIAPGLYRGLTYLKQQIEDGAKNLHLLLKHQEAELEAKGFEIDYLNLFSYGRLAPVRKIKEGEKYILAGAACLGNTRLIDNMIVEL